MYEPKTPLELVLTRVERYRQEEGDSRYFAPCPFHAAEGESLAISPRADGCVKLACSLGCTVANICKGLDLEPKDLVPHGEEAPSPTVLEGVAPQVDLYQGRKLSPVETYAYSLRLDPSKILLHGVTPTKIGGLPTMSVPVRDLKGEVVATRFISLGSGLPSKRWRSGDVPMPYGLWKFLEVWREGQVTLVEDEADCWTLWQHEEPALGLCSNSEHIAGLDSKIFAGVGSIFVVPVPTNRESFLKAWAEMGSLSDKVRVLDLEGHFTVNGFYQASPSTFLERWRKAQRRALPLPILKVQEKEERRRQLWDRCATLARNSDLLERLSADLHRSGVVGEERLAKILMLAMTSRVFNRPVSVLIKGASSSGKNYTLEAILSRVPSGAFVQLTASSEKALLYSQDEYSHRHIVLAEAEALQTGFASYIIRSLLSEGKISYSTAAKMPDGTIKDRKIEKMGPTGLILTTTRTNIHPENETRALSVPTDDSAVQTRKILEAIASGDTFIDAPNVSEWRDFQEFVAMGPTEVQIPYVKEIAKRVLPTAVRMRRDFTTLVNLIKAHALLHQANRARGESGTILAVPEDYAKVFELVHDLLAEGTGASVDPVVRQTVETVTKLASSEEVGHPITAIALALGLDISSTSRRVKKACQLGYLMNLESSSGRPARVVLGEPLPGNRGVLPTPEELFGGSEAALAPRAETREVGPSREDDFIDDPCHCLPEGDLRSREDEPLDCDEFDGDR